MSTAPKGRNTGTAPKGRNTGTAPKGRNIGTAPKGRNIGTAPKRRMSVWRSLRWEQKLFWRNPSAAVFTFVFPLVFLVVFLALRSGDTLTRDGHTIKFAQFYVPAIMAFGVISACYTQFAFTTVIRREQGVFKRKRGTPLPTRTYLAGIVANSVVIGLLIAALVAVAGVVFYGVELPDPLVRLPSLLVVLLVGSFAFAGLGALVSTWAPNEEAASGMINLLLFPALFISGTFGPAPKGSLIDKIASVLPVKPFNEAVIRVFDPFASSAVPRVGSLAVVAAWGIVAVVLAVRSWRWEPSLPTAGRARGRSRSRSAEQQAS